MRLKTRVRTERPIHPGHGGLARSQPNSEFPHVGRAAFARIVLPGTDFSTSIREIGADLNTVFSLESRASARGDVVPAFRRPPTSRFAVALG